MRVLSRPPAPLFGLEHFRPSRLSIPLSRPHVLFGTQIPRLKRMITIVAIPNTIIGIRVQLGKPDHRTSGTPMANVRRAY